MSASSRYRDTLTGQIVEATPEAALVFANRLVQVADDAKPYVPGMFKPGLVGEHDNPEPLTDEQEAAQAALDAAVEAGSPNTNAAKEAKAAKKAADEQAEREAAEAAKADAAARAEAGVSITKTEGQ